ncbi:MAG TPA: glycosyl hydrolase family 28-related protein [Longimicrobiales bacterium]
MALTTITVTARYQDAEGNPASGTVTFRLSTALLDSDGNVIVPPRPIVATLDATGAIAQPLVATNDPTTQPAGVTYQVIERVGGETRVYAVEVPFDAPGGTVDLADLAPVTDATITYGLVKTPSVAGQNTIQPLTDVVPLTLKGGASQTADLLSVQDSAGTELVDITAAGSLRVGGAAVETQTGAQAKVDAHSATTTSVHGIPDTSYLARVPVLTVAASDASPAERALADYACDGVDDQVEINAAIAALGSGGGTVVLSVGTFVVAAPILVPSRTTLMGQGPAATTIRVADGANLDAAIKSSQFDSLTGSNVWRVSDGMQHGIHLLRFRLDGNKAAQTAGAGDGVRLFAKDGYIDNVLIWAPRGRGIYWESGAIIAGPFSGIDEVNQSVIGRLYVMNAGSHGLVLDGVSDGVIWDYTCGGAGGRGLWIIGAPVDVSFAHIWNCQQEGVYCDAQLRAGHLQTESNVSSGLVLNGAHSYVGMLFTQVNNNNQPQHVVINADHCVIGDAVLKGGAGAGPAVHITGDHCRFSGKVSGGTHDVHIRVGDTGAPVNHCVVDATVTASAGRVLEIITGGTGNVVDVTAETTGTATHWDGSHGESDLVRYTSGARRSRDNGAVVIPATATTVTVTHRLARAPRVSEIQVTPLNDLGAATRFWVSNPTATTFDVNVDVAPGASLAKFGWIAELGVASDPLLVVASDTFTGPDGTSLAAHTADTGQAWTVHSGTFTIQGNRLQPSAVTGLQIATLDTGVSDGTFRAVVNLGSNPMQSEGDHHLQVIYRFVDTNNYYFARLRWDAVVSTTKVSLHKKIAGSFSQIVTEQVMGNLLNADHTLEVIVSGDSHTLTLDGVTIGTTTSSDLSTATLAGIAAGSNSYTVTNWRIDDLEVLV